MGKEFSADKFIKTGALSTDILTGDGATIDSATLVHLSGNENILNTKTFENITVTGVLNITGTQNIYDVTNLSVTDSLIYLANSQFNADVLDIGIYGAYGDVNAGHFHTGLVRDASDGIWKLISNAPEPVVDVIDFTGAVYDTLKLGAIQVSSTVLVSNLNADFLDGQHGSYYYQASNPSGFTTNLGTVTSVASGNGLSFTTITGVGTITLGTPSSTTLSSTNATSATSHTHALSLGGTASQYLSGAGTLLTFPTIPTVGTWGGLNYPTWVSNTPFVKMTASGTFSLDNTTYLSANQTITLSGAVTGSGTTAITTTLANSIVGLANLTATGTKDATTYLRGDNTWATIAGGGTVTGSSTIGYVPFWTSTSAIGGSSNFFWDNTNKILGIGTSTPSSATKLHIRHSSAAAYVRIQGLGDVDNYGALELWDDTGASIWQFAHKTTATYLKGFTFAHYNGTAWIQPMALLDSGRILLGQNTADDGSTLLQLNGAVKATGFKTPSGLATQYLMADGSTTTGGGGGGTTSGGTVGEVQYNDGAGGFAGASNVEIESGNLRLVATTDPATPTGGLIHYAKSIAGRVLPKIIGTSGIDTVMQVGLHGNSVFLVSPSNSTTAPTVIGGALTTATTISHQQTIASSAPWQATRRTRFQTSTTAGNATGARTAYGQWYRGSVAGFGGFWFRCQLGMNINLQGGQKFVGLCNLTTALAGDPSALLNMCGMGYDAADLSTGSWFFMYNDGTGTATKVNLGANALRNTTDGYDLIMYLAPNGSELFVRIVNIATNVVVLDTSYTTLLPVANTAMAFKAEVRNGAVVAADNIEIAKVYIETDY